MATNQQQEVIVPPLTMPNFLVIGAAKAGTTALYRYLIQHPEIFMSHPKELRFFPFEGLKPDYRGPGDDSWRFFTKVEDYSTFFAPGAHYRVRGEAAPLYLYHARAAERIRHHIPNAKLIVILRHPADRAYSHYLMMKREGRESLSFRDALLAEDQRVSDNWSPNFHYRRRGLYARQLRPFFDLFKSEQMGIYFYDDYVRDPLRFVQNIFAFLNVDDTFVPDMSERHNETKLLRSPALHSFLIDRRSTKDLLKPLVPFPLRKRIKSHLNKRNLAKPSLAPGLRRELTESYREDIRNLQDMVGRDLSHWLK